MPRAMKVKTRGPAGVWRWREELGSRKHDADIAPDAVTCDSKPVVTYVVSSAIVMQGDFKSS